MSNKRLAGRFLRSTMLTGVAAAAALPAFAQDGEADDRIVVTGTRIQRADLTAPSPVTQINAEQLALTNTVNTEQFLNTLPQVIPGFDSTSNNPGNGTATANLRGLGANRTLVLVDGTRFVASGTGGTVDLNNIPAALVERIEVTTGGGSAVYGSDAVAGVVNFILKDDFEGVQLDVSNEMSASGWDANIFTASLTMGGNFADGRGNAIMSIGYTNREALFQGDRAFSSLSLFDPGPGNEAGGFLSGGSGSALGGQVTSRANLDRETPDPNPGSANVGDPEEADDDAPGFTLADGQTPFYACTAAAGESCTNNITFNGASGGRRFRNPTDQYNYAPVNYLQIPQERYNIYAGASYEISDSMEVYGRGVFTSNSTRTQLAATPVGGTFTVGLDNPNLDPTFVDALIATYDYVDPDPTDGNGRDNSDIQDRDGDGEVDDVLLQISRRYNDSALGVRTNQFERNAFQLQMGLRGDLGENWSYDTFFQFGRSTAAQAQNGNISFSALQAGVTSGLCNIFGIDTISSACASSISKTAASLLTVEQTQFVATVNGSLPGLRMPMAENPVAAAFGVEYREEAGEFTPDSVLGPDIRGFNAALPIKGRYDVYEAFMETQIPVIEGVNFIESFTINGAYRYSDYSLSGSVHTFAVGGDWEPVEDLRIRAQFQRAARAPNIGELFRPAVNGFPGANDPCSDGSGSGNFGSWTPANTANCVAYGVPASAVGTPFQQSGQLQVLTSGGGSTLNAEKGDTLTIGAVWQPAAVDGLTLQVDYYDIKIKGAISAVPFQLLLDDCYVAGNTQTCNTFFGPGTRDPGTGLFQPPNLVTIPAANIAQFTATGIDVQADYDFDLGDLGSISMRYFGNYTIESSFQANAASPVIECAGAYGGNCGEPTPEYKHTMQATWLYGPFTTSLRWRLIGGTSIDFSTFNTSTSISDLSDNVDAFNYLDVTVGYAVSENLDLTVGVQNILGKDAPLLGSTVNEQANTYPATYETLGRQLFFGASVRF